MLPKILIWDVDGVLINVSNSYRRAITETVQYYFSRIMKLPINKELMSVEDTQGFKLAGHFNNDWELTYAAVLCFLTKFVSKSGEKLGTTNLSLNLKKITAEIKNSGGGLQGTEKVLEKKFGKNNLEEGKKIWFRDLIKEIFQELYLGEELFEKKYGKKPGFVPGKGLIRNEKAIVRKDVLKKLAKKHYLGIATGRERLEIEFSLKEHHLESIFKEEFIVTSEDIPKGKPEPDQLLECRRRICSTHGLLEDTKAAYIGDSVDDIRAAKNAGFYSIGCLSAPRNDSSRKELKKEFETLGCDLILDNGNQLLSFDSEK